MSINTLKHTSMDSLNLDQLTIDGDTYNFRFVTSFTNPNDETYEHSIGWIIEPPLKNKGKLELAGVIYKKYWKELDINPFSTRPDKSETVEKYGWLSGPYVTNTFPQEIKEKLEAIFGEYATRNLNDKTKAKTEINSLPKIPQSASTAIFDCTIRVDAGYTEQNTEPINHSASWWFRPNFANMDTTNPNLELHKAYHKQWVIATNRCFETKYPNEQLLSKTLPTDESKTNTDVPKKIRCYVNSIFNEEVLPESDKKKTVIE